MMCLLGYYFLQHTVDPVTKRGVGRKVHSLTNKAKRSKDSSTNMSFLGSVSLNISNLVSGTEKHHP